MTDDDLTRFKYDLLTVIASDPDGMVGLDAKRALDAEYGKTVNHGRLYPNLDDLVDAGLIKKRERVDDGRSNRYVVTQRGVRKLEARYGFVHRFLSGRFELVETDSGGWRFEAHE